MLSTNASTNSGLNQLSHTIARRLARYLECHGLLERDAEHSYLELDHSDEDPIDQLRGHSITYRIAARPQHGLKVFMLQTLSGIEEPFSDGAGQAAGFSLHAGVATKAGFPYQGGWNDCSPMHADVDGFRSYLARTCHQQCC